MRELSLNLRSAINAQESGEIPISLLTVEHDDFEGTMRFSTDPTELVTDVPLVYKTVSRSEDYFFLPMRIILPDEREGAAPTTTIVVSNVTRELVAAIRSVTTPARAKIEIVLRSDLDTVEVETPWLDVISAGNTAGEISLDLALSSMTTELTPSDSFDPASFPGLHSQL